MARSPALFAFGGDGAVELLSAAVVFWRFSSTSHRAYAEERASKIAGGLLFVLAAFVVAASVLTLLGHVEARPSAIGIALLLLAAMIMPWLAAQKRQLSTTTASAALRADATESAVCGYLALIALAGLVANAILEHPLTWAPCAQPNGTPSPSSASTPSGSWAFGSEALRASRLPIRTRIWLTTSAELCPTLSQKTMSDLPTA